MILFNDKLALEHDCCDFSLKRRNVSVKIFSQYNSHCGKNLQIVHGLIFSL